MLSWLEAECCHSSRLDYRGLGEVKAGPDQSPRKELLKQLEAGLCSSLKLDPRVSLRLDPRALENDAWDNSIQQEETHPEAYKKSA